MQICHWDNWWQTCSDLAVNSFWFSFFVRFSKWTVSTGHESQELPPGNRCRLILSRVFGWWWQEYVKWSRCGEGKYILFLIIDIRVWAWCKNYFIFWIEQRLRLTKETKWRWLIVLVHWICSRGRRKRKLGWECLYINSPKCGWGFRFWLVKGRWNKKGSPLI